MLEQIEQLRQELVNRIAEITGIPISEFEVNINFHNQKMGGPLASEAHKLDWYPDEHEGSSWYTSEKPTSGSTVVFIE